MIFSSILIANRGEIACRIIQTAHQMGIHCVAVYVDDDRESPYVKMADQSIRLPDGGYLDGKEIIRAAKESGAQAIHPGYGFLSENAAFARTPESFDELIDFDGYDSKTCGCLMNTLTVDMVKSEIEKSWPHITSSS